MADWLHKAGFFSLDQVHTEKKPFKDGKSFKLYVGLSVFVNSQLVVLIYDQEAIITLYVVANCNGQSKLSQVNLPP